MAHKTFQWIPPDCKYHQLCPVSLVSECPPKPVIDFILPRVPPACQARLCPVTKDDCSNQRLPCHARLPGARPAMSICPERRIRDHHETIQDRFPALPHCENEVILAEKRMTGYKSIAYALPIPHYTGYHPRFPHPLPKSEKWHRPCPKELEIEECCPEDCKKCVPHGPLLPHLCTAQLHPYQSFNQVEKIIKTW